MVFGIVYPIGEKFPAEPAVCPIGKRIPGRADYKRLPKIELINHSHGIWDRYNWNVRPR